MIVKLVSYLLAITFCVGVKTTESQTIPCDTTRCQGFELFPIGELNGTEIDCWSNVRTSNPEWVVSSRSTPSSSTGPNFAGNGNQYIFLETSSPAQTGQSDTLTSPFIDISNLTNPELSFLYHMFGSDMGTLKFEVSDDNGDSWTELDSIVGQQQTASNESWRRQTEDLSNFNSPIAIRFIGVRGNDFRSDMALDDICVQEQQSCPSVISLMAQANQKMVRLDWDAGGAESEWVVSFTLPGANAIQSSIHITNDVFFETILEDFPVGVLINANVRAICGPGDSSIAVSRTIISTNETLISFDNTDTDPAVAFNTIDSSFLIVWSSSDDPTFRPDECEIFGQLFQPDGTALTTKFRISDMGPIINDNTYDAFRPHVAYNGQNNTFLVVWEGDNDTFGLVNEEFEIYGQLLDADGAEIGTNDFLISNAGPKGDRDFDAIRPKVVYNSTDNNFIVAWQASDTNGGLVTGEFEIYSKLISANGQALQQDEVRISQLGVDGDANADAVKVDLVYNATDNEYMAVWIGEENLQILNGDTANFPISLNEPKAEVYGQRISALGVPLGSNDFLISDMASIDGFADGCAIAHNPIKNEYLVALQGDVGNSFAGVFGQLLSNVGVQTGPDHFSISDLHSRIVSQREYLSDVIFNPINNHYLITWAGDRQAGFFAQNDVEIFGQRISISGEEIGFNDFQFTSVLNQRSSLPQLAFNHFENKYFTVFETSQGIGLSINSFCIDMLDDFTLGIPISTGHFLAGESINTASFVSEGSNVTFDVSGTVSVFPEFRVEGNAQFEVLQNGCGL